MATIFDVKRFRNPQFSTFDGSHEIKTSLRISDVAPLDVIPVYEGDGFNLNYSIQAKFKPLVAPAFQRMALKQWNHYVRNQDLWDDFNEFFTGVNPKLGQTAYNAPSKNLIHPFVPCSKSTQVGTSYIGVKLNLSGIDLSGVQVTKPSTSDKWQMVIPLSVMAQCLEQIKSLPRYERFTAQYEDGSLLKSIFGHSLALHLGNNYATTPLLTRLTPITPNIEGIVTTEDSLLFQCSDSDTNINEDGSIPFDDTISITDIFKYATFRGFKPLFEHGTLCDYLGYPANDFSQYYSSGLFFEDLKKQLASMTIDDLGDNIDTYISLSCIHNYITPINDNLPIINTDEYLFTQECIQLPKFDDDYKDFVLPYFTGLTGNQQMFAINLDNLCAYYIAWMYLNQKNTTMLDDCPYFCIIPLKTLVQCSDQPVDSLRIRGYHKIINDYFRDVNLTAEIPIPFRDGGNDLENYYNAVSTYLDSSLTSEELLRDWWRTDLIKNKKFNPFPNDDDFNIDFIIENDSLREYFFMLKTWDTLTNCFKHLRDRDYLTGLLPNSSIVDVVAPIMSTQQVQQAYENSGKNSPFTNTSISVDDDNNLVHNNSDIDPYKAGSDVGASPSPVGWLDIENLRITQKLKNYFVKLRYALNGIKDFSKVFFNVDVSDLEVGRAQFLSGNMQLVTINEIVQSASTDISALGSLGGRANSFGNTDYINKDFRYTGFLISTICLSPLESLIGGLDRQLIKQDRFDYFLPDFAELGDQSVNKIEANVMPMLFNHKKPNYNDVLGYTMRYMEYKYIANRVHADFLGQKADWHLDIIQKPINPNDVELSQEFLEEQTDDNRIFTDVYDDEMNCDIWCMCNCTFRRALPAINYSEIVS